MNSRHEIMNDEDFWSQLEYDASRWFSASEDKYLRRFWIDGFIPQTIKDTKFGVDVEGRVWIGEGRDNQYQYSFVASVPQNMLTCRRKNFIIENIIINEERQRLKVVVIRDRSVTVISPV